MNNTTQLSHRIFLSKGFFGLALAKDQNTQWFIPTTGSSTALLSASCTTYIKPGCDSSICYRPWPLTSHISFHTVSGHIQSNTIWFKILTAEILTSCIFEHSDWICVIGRAYWKQTGGILCCSSLDFSVDIAADKPSHLFHLAQKSFLEVWQ